MILNGPSPVMQQLLTSSEALSTDSDFDPSGNISGVAVTASGSGTS